MTNTLFQKIIDRELPADIIYEDELCLAFNDINPQAPVHILVIPKAELTQLSEATNEHQNILGHMMVKVAEIASNAGLKNDYRVVINNGADACQTVFHLHIHIIGGRKFTWPPG